MLFPLRLTAREKKGYVLTAAQSLSYRVKPEKIRQKLKKKHKNKNKQIPNPKQKARRPTQKWNNVVSCRYLTCR